jgi:exonuclease III
MPVSILSCNAQGLNTAAKQVLLASILNQNRPALCALQETKLVPGDRNGSVDRLTKKLYRMNLHPIYGRNDAHAAGVATLYNPFRVQSIGEVYSDKYCLITLVQLGGVPIVLINNYGPNKSSTTVSERQKRFADVIAAVRSISVQHIILLGDHNALADPSDRFPINGEYDRDFKDFITELGLVCGHSVCNSSKFFTFVDRQSGSQTRIDAVFVTPSLANMVHSINKVYFTPSTDHFGINLVLRVPKVSPQSAYVRTKWDLSRVSAHMFNQFCVERDERLRHIDASLSDAEQIKSVYRAMNEAAVAVGIPRAGKPPDSQNRSDSNTVRHLRARLTKYLKHMSNLSFSAEQRKEYLEKAASVRADLTAALRKEAKTVIDKWKRSVSAAEFNDPSHFFRSLEASTSFNRKYGTRLPDGRASFDPETVMRAESAYIGDLYRHSSANVDALFEGLPPPPHITPDGLPPSNSHQDVATSAE